MSSSPDTERTNARQQKRFCQTCYFSRKIGGKLHCLKNPPVLNEKTGEARWPIVKSTDICGSFRYTDERTIESDQLPTGELPIYRDGFGDYCKVPLSKGRFAKVDPEDYPWLAQFRWHMSIKRNLPYAVRSVMFKRKRTSVLMHRMIMNTPKHLVCDHINHNSLDNRNEHAKLYDFTEQPQFEEEKTRYFTVQRCILAQE